MALSDASAAYFYDTVLNVTWLANMNVNGEMNWNSAVAWASGLSDFGGGWRLPKIIDSGLPGCDFSNAGGTDCGFNVQTQVDGAYSEWAHLYYVTLGNLAYCPPGDESCAGGPQAGWGLTNTAYFQNMQSEDMLGGDYWSGTEYAASPILAWAFSTFGGEQFYTYKANAFYAVAVRAGDVPEPGGLVLALTALAGLGVSLRRRAA